MPICYTILDARLYASYVASIPCAALFVLLNHMVP